MFCIFFYLIDFLVNVYLHPLQKKNIYVLIYSV